MGRGRWCGAAVLAAVCGLASAQDPKPYPDAKAFDKLVVDTLREVHDRGADLYNTKKDYGGAYRLYQGSLLTVKPMLAHRPDAQKLIEAGLAAAEKETDPATRAYLLHKAIEDLRAHIRSTPLAEAPQPPEIKKAKANPPEPMTPEPPKPATPAKLGGKVTFDGKPLAAGTVTFASLNDPKAATSTATLKDGQYALELAPGQYSVAVSAAKDGKEMLPQKYVDAKTSGLLVEVKAGANSIDLDLKK